MKNKLIGLLLVFIVATIGMVYAYTESTDITAGVVVPATCVLSLNSSTINFGSVSSNTDTGAANEIVEVSNNGNAITTSVTINGTQWIDAGANNFAVGQTEWFVSGFTYGSGTALSGTATSIGSNIAASGSQNLYFGVEVPSAQVAATYEQNITIIMNC